MSTSEASEQANRAEIEPVRIVVMFLLVAGVITGLFFGQVFSDVAARFQLGGAAPLIEGITFSTPPQVLGFVLAIGAAVYAWVNPQVRAMSTDVANELMRVTWPTFEETRLHTFAVVVASLVAAAVLFGIDRLAYQVMVYWLPSLVGRF
jgi:preprotein translocase subunit SecE